MRKGLQFFFVLFGISDITIAALHVAFGPSAIVYFLLATFFVGGLARLVSIAAVGALNGFFVAMTVLELAVPPLAAAGQYRIARTVA